jgi:hypothetical protein
MTELIERRLTDINEKLELEIVEISDVRFLIQLLKQQAKVIEELRGDSSEQEDVVLVEL